MTPYEIPLSAAPQSFLIALSGTTYALTVKWNGVNAAWTLDIASADGTPIVSGIPLVTGVDLLEPFQYLGIGGSLLVQSDNDPNEVPTFESLGTTGHLYFVTIP